MKPLPVPLTLKPGDSSEAYIWLFARPRGSYLARIFRVTTNQIVSDRFLDRLSRQMGLGE